MDTISIRFPHGLGDCANFAHLLKLYVDKGFEVTVEVDESKAPMFRAAGATIGHGAFHHPYLHPPAPGRPEHHDHWSGNKLAYNVSYPPLPHIGSYQELWNDICNVKLTLDDQVNDITRHMVASYFATLPRPIVLCHFQGNTGTESKNLSWEEQGRCLRGLLDRTDGTMILLDWDDRLYKMNSYRVRHMEHDWRKLNTLELYEAIRQCDLIIGVDSGPLHLARFTSTPAVGVWTHHYPSHFALPRAETLNVVPRHRVDLTRYRRIPYNVVEVDGDRQDGDFVAAAAASMLAGRQYMPGATAAQDYLLQQLVARTRTLDSSLSRFVDRHRSFDKLFKLATERRLTRWVETGCIRSVDDWTAGYSTYLFGLYLMHQRGRLDSVDLDTNNAAFAMAWTKEFGRTVAINLYHSHNYLTKRTSPIDVAYLDSADVGMPQYEECCLREAQLVLPLMTEHGLILIDDTCWSKGRFNGKGSKAVPCLLKQGFKIMYAGYQVLLSRC